MNYNTLRNKPTINYRELIGDSTVSEVGGITEEEFDQLLDTDLASYYTKAQINELFARSFIYKEKSGSIVTFDCPTNTNGISEVTSEIVAVQSGTGDPSPTNIRPITGWSAVNVYRRGKNLFEVTATSKTESGVTWTVNSDGTVTVSGTATGYTSIYVGEARVKSSMGKVTISGISGATNIAWGNLDLKDENDNTLYSITSGSTYSNFIVDLSQYPSAYKITMTLKRNNNGDVSGTIKPQVEFGTTATTYEAFSGTTYTTTLKDSQGNPLICYGGELSNENGVQSLKNDIWQGILIPTASQLSVDSDKKHCTIYLSEQANGYTLADTQLKCNKLKPSSYSTAYDNHVHFANALILAVYLEDEVGDTKNAWIQWFTDNQIQICYKLATPQTIPQDNLAIASSAGINNIWCDSGDITVKALDRIIQG